MMTARPVSGAKIRVIDRLLYRRMQVVVMYGGFITYGVTTFVVLHSEGTVKIAAGFAGAIATLGGLCAAWRLLRSSMGGAGSLYDGDLDERQRFRKYTALRIAYPAVSNSATTLLCCMALGQYFPVLRNNTFITAAFWTMVVLTMTLPAAVLAWTEPDTIPE